MNDLLPSLPGRVDNVLFSLSYFKPEICLTALFILVLVTDLVYGKSSAWLCRIVALIGLAVVIQADLYQYPLFAAGPKILFNDMLLLHHPGVVFKLIIDTLTVLILLYFPCDNQLSAHSKGLSDAYTIIIGSVLGVHLMLMAVNLLSVYLAVEMVSIASYLLVAYQSDKALSAEASLKFVLFGMASSAVMLYGISLLYAFTGTLSLFDPNFTGGLLQLNSLSALMALLLVFAGIGFKLGFVPLHFWVPDVYQGSATPVMAYISTIPKIGAFGLLINFLTPFVFNKGWTVADFQNILAGISIVTMLAGNFAAVWQTNVKRILAYSSIGHTGFALMAVLTFTPQGISSLAFYLAVYAIANIGALMLVTYFKNTAGADDISDYKGLGLQHPVASVAFIIILISLTGLPVTAGFNAKLLVFSSVYGVYQHSRNLWLLATLVTGALTTVVSLFYYLKVPLNLFLKKGAPRQDFQNEPFLLTAFYLLAAVFILITGIFPDILAKYL